MKDRRHRERNLHPHFLRARLRHICLMLFMALVASACGDCGDPLDPRNYIDVRQFYPDTSRPQSDAGHVEDAGSPQDSGRRPKDADFVFDFGDPDAGDSSFALTTVVPDFGPVEGGNLVRVEGSGLTEGSRVFIGGRPMDVELVQGSFVGRVPPGSGPGVVTVKVLAPDGQTRVLVDAYEYVRGLAVESIVPTRIPTSGGVEVEIRGAGFAPRTGVSFSGDAALRVTYVDDTVIRAIAPPRPRGRADLRITTPAESIELEDAIEYYDPIQIDAVIPASGTSAGGELVEVRGSGFTSDVSVDFGAKRARVVSVDAAAGAITVETPPHAAGVVDVFVRSPRDSAVLKDGFYYRSNDAPFVANVNPRRGPTDGGNEVLVTGWGFDAPAAEVTFAGVPSTILDSDASWARVQVPPGALGPADVALVSAGVELARKADAYRYVEPLTLSDVTPARGPASGGTSVTLAGSGFTGASAVRFDGVGVEFTVVSDTEIRATTGSHRGGTVDVTVVRDELEARLSDAFTFEAELEVWGFTPVRGAIAGGTYVEVRGAGFFGELSVALDGRAASQIRRVDRNMLVLHTPPNAPGEADLEVTAGQRSALGPYTFLYFDPASRFGGASGGPVEGAVNVTVFSMGGGPIEDAFVMLSTRADTPYQGYTDANGQVTLSGPDVVGAQTTTATAAGYSTATIQTVDAENITLFLNQLDPQNGPGAGSPPPFGTIHGTIKARGKMADPDDEDTHDLSIVRTTQQTIYGGNPPPGPGAIVVGNGHYEITTRTGDMAVIGLCGTYHEPSDTFTPLFLAVERYVFISDKERLEIDLVCDIPLDQTHTYKLVNPAYAPDGPNNNRVQVFWDFGFEGLYPSPTWGRGFGSLIEVERQPPLHGALEDISFMTTGGSYTGRGAPYTQATLRHIREVDATVQLPPLLDVPEPVTPMPGGTVQNRTITFQLSGPYHGHFQFVVLRNDSGIPVWQFILPADQSTIILPEFPDFSSRPVDQRPNPMAGGQLYMTIYGVRMLGGHVYEAFSYRDIDVDQWEAYSLTSWAIRLR